MTSSRQNCTDLPNTAIHTPTSNNVRSSLLHFPVSFFHHSPGPDTLFIVDGIPQLSQ